MSKPTAYTIRQIAAEFDHVRDDHVLFALAAGWSEKRARREFAAFERRREARPDQLITRGADDPRASRIRRLAGKDVPRWLLQKALDENWSIGTAATAFLRALREKTT